MPLLSIEQLVAWRSRHDRVTRVVETTLPTGHGPFRAIGYRDQLSGQEHLALVRPAADGTVPLVRLHSECLTGDVLGSQRCDCGAQLEQSLARVAAEGGAVVYLRGHEGRGVGLVDKLRAYRLQDDGLDTVDAQTALGLPVDGRDYAAAAAVLTDLGLTAVRLLTNNPDKVSALRSAGTDVTDVVGLTTEPTPANAGYLRTKRDRMGHRLLLAAAPGGSA
nr:GTP cyclohydrolase II [Auraticoccus cholistanensis]